MSYIRNADLTRDHVLHLVHRLGYEDIAASCRRGEYVPVLAVRTPENEIIEFRDLSHARRFLWHDLASQRSGLFHYQR